ncbi:hypothetical protein [Methylobacterium sp. JK268]
MDLLDALAALLGVAADPLFGDGILHRADAAGGFADVPIRCRTESLDAGEEGGLPGRRLTLTVLLAGLDPAPTCDDEVSVPDGRWRIVAVARDPAGSHCVLQARPAQ